MNNGGNSNINNAPVDHMAPVFDHLNTVDAMKAALAHPAFEAKYGDLLRAKHPVLARASENAKASDRLNGRGAQAMDGNFMPKGWEQTPFDDSTLAVARGEQQRDTDPRTVAGLDGYLAGPEGAAEGMEQVQAAITAALKGEQVAEVVAATDETNPDTGSKGVDSRAFQEGQTQKPRDISPLVVNLAAMINRLDAAVRKGGIRKHRLDKKTNKVGIFGVKGIRGGADAAVMDAATHERKRLKAAMDAAETQAAETGAEMAPIPTRWDARLGQYVLAR